MSESILQERLEYYMNISKKTNYNCLIKYQLNVSF